MKNISATNRLGLYLNAALLALSLALLAGTPTVVGARDCHGKIVHPILKSGVAHGFGHSSGPLAMSLWWLRRWW